MRFGILGTADIARRAVIPAIAAAGHEVAAIASRDAERAASAADEFDIPESYGRYDDLVEEADVDAVYNPLPNALHAEWTKRAADAGLDVLCEKPLAVDAAEAEEVHEHCEDRDVTLMEAFMYRYHPRTERAASVVAERFEDVRLVKSDFQFPLRGAPDDVRLNPELAGGSLMDVGCYTVSASRLFLGEPTHVSSAATDTRGAGVETQIAGVLEFEDGAMATVSSSFDTEMVQSYRVEATNGWLEASTAFDTHGAGETQLEYAVDGRRVVETFDPADPYELEVEHFVDCVESDSTPRTDGRSAIRTMRVIDALYESATGGGRTAV